jgi:glutamine synthetase
LRPVFSCPDPIRGGNNLLVLCEVMKSNGAPHDTNTRAQLRAIIDPNVEAEAPLFKWEQEYSACTLHALARPLSREDY